ncbi:MAG: elongation factor 1-beta [Archaeoglobi archaeon]|nr:elongation factor 1-beta [Archaeoglobi archaeon]MDK2781695.1 elongation factor 1-beta [Archaeoglobi archaeon]
MGEVLARIKIMPEGADINLEELKKRIEEGMPEGARLQRVSEEPVAFGLRALVADVIVDDAEGGTDKIEDFISSLEGVSSIQIVSLTRLL